MLQFDVAHLVYALLADAVLRIIIFSAALARGYYRGRVSE